MIILFLGGVILGFNQAGKGMDKVRGNDNPQYDAVEVNDDGEVVEMFGESIKDDSLEEKKEQYADINEDFITEKIASAIEKGVKWFFNIIVEGAYQVVQLFYRA